MVIAVDPYLLLDCPVSPMSECRLLRSQSRYPSTVEITPELATTTQTTAAASRRIYLCEAAVPVVPHSNMGHCLSKKPHIPSALQLAAARKSGVAPTAWGPMPIVSAPGAVDASPAQGSGGRPEVPNKMARLRCFDSLLTIMCAARLCVDCGGFAYVCFRRQVTKVAIMLLGWASSGAGGCGMACGRGPECITSPSSFPGPLPRP